MIDDFENVLSALIALRHRETEEYFTKCQQAQEEGYQKPDISFTSIDKLMLIWKELFPQRDLRYRDSKFFAAFEKDGIEQEYSATQMSDGERSVLYLSAQVLCVPERKILIIDEPEIHLHRSLINRLWVILEQFRPDCLFIYITHDTQFAAMHSHAEKIWIREFDGENWKIAQPGHSELPEDLLLDILGNRNPVLFVEGEKNSYDTKLYTYLYPQYYVIPGGSCSQVIARTKAFQNIKSLHHCDVYGIIDRDYRSEYEIAKYKENKIYTIEVSEVENLFLIDGLLKIIAEHMAIEPNTAISAIHSYVIEERFKKQIQTQICQSVVAQLKYQLNSAEISKTNEQEAKRSLDNILANIDFEKIKKEQEKIFNDALAEGYASVLKVFNEKGIVKSVGHFFGIENKNFCQLVLGLLNGEKREAIISVIKPYLPMEIPLYDN